MSRFAQYFGLAAVLIIIGIIVILSNRFALIPNFAPSAPRTASSSIAVLPPATPLNLPPETVTTISTTTTVATTAPQKTSVKPPLKITKAAPKPVVATSTAAASTPVSAPAPTQLTSSGNVPLDTAASTLRAALVNIICYAPAGGTLHSISGSGIFIDSKGIILTNAHVAQYFLLKDKGVSCTIRSGSPAMDKYEAGLIYISPSWIHANATVLTQTLPSGTGEYDFALLAVTKSATTNSLPSTFPSLPLAQLPPAALTPIVLASYGAQFLESSQIQSSLYPTIVFGSVKEVYTFATNTIDVLALGGSAAAQEGSSGGGVADASGMLVGTITTSTVVGSTDTRSLSAITASYIRSAYAREMGSTLDSLLSEPTATAVTEFAPQIPVLESIVTAHL